ncbi:hypothetical protein CBI38_08340 [Rhodococcus oxybenzonivorans]|uniref:Uncharacterized protein n=1 Tax=Rhodococcus oxybenzonivorans TaxID=1990687 RepID=A0A2S2BSL8_9NOCA|nr:hypothetical protein [Rhodococcus oxybenzonivorans]AWK71601.1 hypothetical protein CBI38_08340 [Rhodococcus oxybenzonivorans]
MDQHNFEVELPSDTSFESAEEHVLQEIVGPRMLREGKDGYADLHVDTKVESRKPGISIFAGSYKL